jgi:hypothetical protein
LSKTVQRRVPIHGRRSARCASLIDPPYGGGVLVDFTTCCARVAWRSPLPAACSSLVAPRGPIIVRTTVKTYTNTLPRFFAYLATTTDRIDGPADLRARHIDGFEAWLEAAGKSRVHLPTYVAKIVAVLRRIATDTAEPSTPSFASGCATSVRTPM